METNEHPFDWLELMDRPAFCAKDGVVTAVNTAALARMLQPGTDINEIVTQHRDTYENLNGGCLYLTVCIAGLPCNACVTRTKECDVFVLQQDADADQLQMLALAAQQLRIPLSNVMTVTDRLLSNLETEDAATEQQASQIQHGLFQLLRIIGNMSDTGRYQIAPFAGMQMVNLTAVINEIMEKIQTASSDTDITVTYCGLEQPVLGLGDPEKLERAVYNLISNALKFSPAGSIIETKLTKSDNTLSFTVCNPCSEQAQEQSFWNRYRREPAIEDSRYGLGLGMTLISTIATVHGGTVLVDYPKEGQARVTMTLSIQKGNSDNVRSPMLRIGDYAGGRDKALLEFAEILSTDAYKNIH